MSARRPGPFLATTAMAVTVGALLAGSTGLAQAGAARTGTAQSGGTWNDAVTLTGPSGQVDVTINSVSCPSAGNCLAGGYYQDKSHGRHALVASEQSGRWGRGIELPGTAKLNTGGLAVVASVSCPSAGNCTADGTFGTNAKKDEVFMVGEVAGRWGQVHTVPGFIATNAQDGPEKNSLACASPGNCVAGGYYRATNGALQAFVADETNGQWGNRVLLTGAGLRASRSALIEAVACPSAGNCSASGYDLVGTSYQLFAVSETGGHWGRAVPISLSQITVQTVGFFLDSMSCYSAGNCAVGGAYQWETAPDSVVDQPVVISEINGQWGPAMDVPALTRPAEGGFGWIDSVSCVAPDTCTASGSYPDSKTIHAFVVTDTGGQWGNAVTISRSAAISDGRPAEAFSVSCGSPGNCVAGGDYALIHSGFHPFLVTETSGHWGQAQPVAGAAKLPPSKIDGIDGVTSISCASVNHCTAVGDYDLFRTFATTES